MDTTLITLSDISLKTSENIVLNHTHLTVYKGACHIITGKSGSGKTMLLKAIAGSVNLNRGTLQYHFGTKNIPIEQLIAFAGTKHHFKNLSNTGDLYYQQRYNSADAEDSLTVRAYLQAIKANDHSTVYWTIKKAVNTLNLNHLFDKAIIKLSNGETRRLMLAASLLKNPILLLLDDPLAGLDTQTRDNFDTLLGKILASGITVILATTAENILQSASHISILNEGTLQTYTKSEFNITNVEVDHKPIFNTPALEHLLNTVLQKNYHMMVNMQDVVIKYGNKLILNKINWLIKPGERWALLGHNGAGKSTLLSLINGDNPQAYANDITLFDQKRGTGESIWDIKSKIGFVSPELHQYFPADNSCLQVIESGFYDTLGLFRQSSKAKAGLAMEWMKALEIDRYARMLLKNIPASAQRLCLLARALIKNPPLLIFDEPCQGLDDHQKKHFLATVDTICRLSNVTLIYVTHYQQEIPESVNKLLRLENGEVVSSE